jgi:hypothetical protein
MPWRASDGSRSATRSKVKPGSTTSRRWRPRPIRASDNEQRTAADDLGPNQDQAEPRPCETRRRLLSSVLQTSNQVAPAHHQRQHGACPGSPDPASPGRRATLREAAGYCRSALCDGSIRQSTWVPLRLSRSAVRAPASFHLRTRHKPCLRASRLQPIRHNKIQYPQSAGSVATSNQISITSRPLRDDRIRAGPSVAGSIRRILAFT